MRDADISMELEQTGNENSPQPRRSHKRLWIALAILLPLLIIAFAVPLININRFQRRIIAGLSESLGRPIHLDTISLTVFPIPGLEIENLTVAEDPAFGAEPFIHADSVRATLRFSSLWRRRIEFSSISLTDPSINLVHTSDGRWNIESFLLRASRLHAAPTAQRRASAAPRFPYIEASGARLNLKLGNEKEPLSLTDADLAFWLSNPQEWQLRLKGDPVRTDRELADSNTGTVRIEGTLGHSVSLEAMPIDLKAEWREVPMGEASRIITGRDAGLRGSLTLTAAAQGTAGNSTVQTNLHLSDLRRADFIPAHALTLDVECLATQEHIFHSLSDVRCSWPPALAGSMPRTLALTGSIPDVHHLSTASIGIGSPGIPASTLLEWAHIASAHLSPHISATGTLTGSITFDPASRWSGQISFADGSLTVPEIGSAPLFKGPLAMRLAPSTEADIQPQLLLPPIPLNLGGKDFATLDARFDPNGYTLHLTGTSLPEKLYNLTSALPLMSDGLTTMLPPKDTATPLRFDLIGTRSWGHPTVWSQNVKPSAVPARHRSSSAAIAERP